MKFSLLKVVFKLLGVIIPIDSLGMYSREFTSFTIRKEFYGFL